MEVTTNSVHGPPKSRKEEGADFVAEALNKTAGGEKNKIGSQEPCVARESDTKRNIESHRYSGFSLKENGAANLSFFVGTGLKVK